MHFLPNRLLAHLRALFPVAASIKLAMHSRFVLSALSIRHGMQ